MIKTEIKTYTTDPLGYYAELEVSNTAGDDVIKQSYREKAKYWHPDHNTSEEALEKFQKISVAYDILKDEKNRLMYDLLAQAYPKEKFPDMFALKVYKNRKGEEDISVRALSLRQVVGKLVKYSDEMNLEICNFKEAQSAVLKNSLINLFLGWWSVQSVPHNIDALISNYKGINKNTQENLTLLIHNAYAYHQDKKDNEAYLSAYQALNYANPYQQELLKRFMASLDVRPQTKLPTWNFNLLKYLQLVIPGIVALLLVMPFSAKVLTNSELNRYFAEKPEGINYYQEVKFRTGGRTVDDVVVSKILNIPANTDDLNMLYHLTEATDVMYGPDEDFDVLKKAKSRTTVRVTGYTPDKQWFRVMLDNGDMGFVKAKILKKGIGAEIPEGSKIYTGIKIK